MMDDIDLIALLRSSTGYPKVTITLIDNRQLFKRALVLSRSDIGKATVQRFAGMRKDFAHISRTESQIADQAGLDPHQVLFDIQEPLYPDGLHLDLLKDDRLIPASDLSTTIKTMTDSQWDYWHASIYSPREHRDQVKKAAQEVLNLDLRTSSQKKLTD